MVPQGFKALVSSEKVFPAQARLVGPIDSQERLEVSVYLRARVEGNPAGDEREHAQQPGQRMRRD
jgi:hypothetical protein